MEVRLAEDPSMILGRLDLSVRTPPEMVFPVYREQIAPNREIEDVLDFDRLTLRRDEIVEQRTFDSEMWHTTPEFRDCLLRDYPDAVIEEHFTSARVRVMLYRYEVWKCDLKDVATLAHVRGFLPSAGFEFVNWEKYAKKGA